jgi:hypothetical protein
VQPNLFEFLAVVRADPELQDYQYWIDALCINQANPAERNHQVAQMGSISAQAQLVVSWLGYMQTRSRPLPVNRRYRYVSSTNGLRELEYWTWIANNEYWSRAWITQEIILARRISIRTGSVAHTLEQCRWSKRYYESAAFKFFYDYNGYRDMIMRRSLALLLFHLRANKCSIARDRIFSLLSICSEKGRIQVDYESPVFQFVYQVLSVSSCTVCVCTTMNILGILRLEIDQLSANDLALLASDGPYLEFSFARSKFDLKSDSALQDEVYCELLNEITDWTKPRDQTSPAVSLRLPSVTTQTFSQDVLGTTYQGLGFKRADIAALCCTAIGSSVRDTPDYIIHKDSSWLQDGFGDWKFRVCFVYIWNYYKGIAMYSAENPGERLCARVISTDIGAFGYSPVHVGWGSLDLHADQ